MQRHCAVIFLLAAAAAASALASPQTLGEKIREQIMEAKEGIGRAIEDSPLQVRRRPLPQERAPQRGSSQVAG